MTEEHESEHEGISNSLRAYSWLTDREYRADLLRSEVNTFRDDIFKAATLAHNHAKAKKLDPLLCVEFSVSLEGDRDPDLRTQLGFLEESLTLSTAEWESYLNSLRSWGHGRAALRELKQDQSDAAQLRTEYAVLNALPVYLAEISRLLHGWAESDRDIAHWTREHKEDVFSIRRSFLEVVTTPVFGPDRCFERSGQDVRPHLLDRDRRDGVDFEGLAKRLAIVSFWNYLCRNPKPVIGFCEYHRCGRPFLVGRKKRFCGPKCTRAHSAADYHKGQSIERCLGIFPAMLDKAKDWTRRPSVQRNTTWKRYLTEIPDVTLKFLAALEHDAQLESAERHQRFLRRVLRSTSEPIPEEFEKLTNELEDTILRAIQIQREMEINNAKR